MTTFREKYLKTVVPHLKEVLGETNIHAVPKITKVTLNVGLSKGLKEARYIDTVESTLRRITGQAPVKTKARKSISNFKIREGMVVGMMVTLRGARMEEFLEKLVTITFPRVRDFQGISERVVDRNGNMTIGFKEHVAFPEIRTDEIDNLHGLEITVVSTAGTKERGLALFKALGFPLKK